MNESLESNYQEDILKVKQIWKDIQECQEPKKKKQSGRKNSNAEKRSIRKSPPSAKDKLLASKSDSSQNFGLPKSNDKMAAQLKQIKAGQTSSPGNRKKSGKGAPEQTDCEILEFSTGSKQSQQIVQLNENQKPLLSAPARSDYAQIYSLNKRLEEKDYELSLLRVTNRRNSDKIAELERKIDEKERLIEKFKLRENELLSKTIKNQSKELNFEYGKLEYENFRSDSKRLLKMLQATEQYQSFANLALDDGGVRFLHEANKSHKSSLDLKGQQASKMIHYCTCNKEFIPEASFWVPKDAYQFARKFVKDSGGEMTQAETELLLYELNKIWREREKRILNSMNALKVLEVDKYKRRLKNVKASSGGHFQTAVSDIRLSNYH